MLASWIVVAGNLFGSVIVRNEIAITEMPSVQLSSLFGNNESMIEAYIKERRATLIQAIFEELGDITLQVCQIPRKDDILNASKDQPIYWDACNKFTRNEAQ